VEGRKGGRAEGRKGEGCGRKCVEWEGRKKEVWKGRREERWEEAGRDEVMVGKREARALPANRYIVAT
jgi:phage gp37-like protein